MEVSHTPVDKPTARDVWTALEELPQRVSALLKKYESPNDCRFEEFERELHSVFAQTECAVTEEALARHDVDLPYVFIDGEGYRRACRCAQTYLTGAGPVSVTRTLYRARRGERAVAALERKVGIVEGYWTPLAARQGAMLVSHLTPRDAEEVLATLGHMQPSKSSLDRLPKALSARWEAQREDFETTVREATVEVPDAARAVVVSLDGVMAPMRGGYREAGCATVSLVDGDGERLHSVRMGRMPQSKKATLKTMVAAEVEAVLAKRPDLTVVKLADGAKDNWTFLTRALPEGVELIDFYHAAEHLKDAFDTAHGADSPKAAAQFKKYRHLLRHEPDGVNRVIRALLYLRSRYPGNERIAQVLGYFRGNRHRMRYADAKARTAHRFRRRGGGVQDSGHRTAQTLRHAMGAAWRASHSDATLARPKPPIRSRVVSARANVSNTGVLSHKCRAHASSQSSLIMISFGATPTCGRSARVRAECPGATSPRPIPTADAPLGGLLGGFLGGSGWPQEWRSACRR